MNSKIMKYILGLAIISFAAGTAVAADKALVYHSFSNDGSDQVIAETIIEIEPAQEGGSIISRRKQFDHCMVEDEFKVDEKLSLKSWRRTCKGEGTNFSAVREGEILRISGQNKGKAISKEINLGAKELHIYPKYTLSQFALSGAPSFKFWTLRRDKLTKLPMKAVRKGIETVTLGGKEVEAIKVYYSIADKLREKSFNHNYYFRKTDGLFIKKEENSGRVELLTKEGK